jgi:hypothetical protein
MLTDRGEESRSGEEIDKPRIRPGSVMFMKLLLFVSDDIVTSFDPREVFLQWCQTDLDTTKG